MKQFPCQWTHLYWMPKEREGAQNRDLSCGNLILEVTSCCFYHIIFTRNKSVSPCSRQGCEYQEAGTIGGHLGCCLPRATKLEVMGCAFYLVSLCHFLGMRPLGPLSYLQSQWAKMVSQLIKAITWCLWRVGDRLLRSLSALKCHPSPPPYGKPSSQPIYMKPQSW